MSHNLYSNASCSCLLLKSTYFGRLEMGKLKKFFWQHAAWLLPILVVGVIAPFTPYLDRTISAWFYNQNQPPSFHANWLTHLFYNYGEWPAFMVFFLAFCVVVGSYFSGKWKPWRAPALVLVLTLILGAGILINGVLKEYWGRPRPKQTVEFAGQQTFRPFFSPNIGAQPEPSKSFPSGHAAMGFYFFSLAYIGYRQNNRALLYGGITVAIVLGIGLSSTRIAQGGHWFSDTLFAALFMWLCTLFSAWLVYPRED